MDPVLDRFRAEIAGARAVQLAFDRFARHCAKTYDDCPTGSGPEQARQRVNALLDRLKERSRRPPRAARTSTTAWPPTGSPITWTGAGTAGSRS